MLFTRFAIRLFAVTSIVLIICYVYTIYHAVAQATVMSLSTGKRYVVHPDLLVASGLGRGEIGKTATYGHYSLINPDHKTAATASLKDTELVIGIKIPQYPPCAYTRSVLLRHQVINETLGTHSIVIALCPFTDTVTCFMTTVYGDTIKFGVAGLLYSGSLVIYDQSTYSYWSAFEGRALIGPMSGCILEKVPFVIMTWKAWSYVYPETLVVCDDYEDDTDYTFDPYCKLYLNPEYKLYGTFFSDHRLVARTPVIGLLIDDVAIAYPVEKVCNLECIQDNYCGTSMLVTAWQISGDTGTYPIAVFDCRLHNSVLSFIYKNGQIEDTKTQSVWNKQGYAYKGPLAGSSLKRLPIVCTTWFAWSLFYPKTRIY